MTTPAAPATPAKTKTSYIILEKKPGGGAGDPTGDIYVPLANNVEANNAAAAVKKYAEANPPKTSFTLVAVPANRFKPVKVTAIQTTVVKLQ